MGQVVIFERAMQFPPADHGPENPEEKLSAEEILRRLVEEDEDHTENTRYILAVMLERRKLLRETDSQRTPNGILRVPIRTADPIAKPPPRHRTRLDQANGDRTRSR